MNKIHSKVENSLNVRMLVSNTKMLTRFHLENSCSSHAGRIFFCRQSIALVQSNRKKSRNGKFPSDGFYLLMKVFTSIHQRFYGIKSSFQTYCVIKAGGSYDDLYNRQEGLDGYDHGP